MSQESDCWEFFRWEKYVVPFSLSTTDTFCSCDFCNVRAPGNIHRNLRPRAVIRCTLSSVVAIFVGVPDRSGKGHCCRHGPEVSPGDTKALEVVAGINVIKGSNSWIETVVGWVVEVDAPIAATHTVVETCLNKFCY